MTQNSAQLNRQATWATFESILNEEQLIQAVRMLDSHQVDGDIYSMIAFIKRVGEKFAIDIKTLKTLYPKYYAYINTPGIELPEDPLLRKLQQSGTAAGNNAVAEIKEAKDKPPSNVKRTDDEDNNPELCVFCSFIESLLSHFPDDQADLLEQALSLVCKDKSFSGVEQEEIKAWLKEPDQYQWNFVLAETAMSRLVHHFYVVLCDLLGPIDADKLFHQVLDDCKRLPAAKKFSPTRFL
ncbi:MAG: hypothetical protein ACU85E_16925 [Gammaproteobacteria bacterium]